MLSYKNITIILWVFLSTVILSAGGDKNAYLPTLIDMPNKTCKTDKLYVEKDTDLMWQDQAYVDAEDGAYANGRSVGKVGRWNHALNYCRALNYKGFSDWKLPTSDELMHVHRKEGQVFTYFRDNDFWSSTPTSEKRYYVVFPADTYRYKRSKKESNYIRCVRCIEKSTAPKQRIKY